MVLKEDCINFRYTQKDISGLGDKTKRLIDMPNCVINKMALGGCPDNCSDYEKH